jgi:hypothetical protein
MIRNVAMLTEIVEGVRRKKVPDISFRRISNGLMSWDE